MAEYIEIGTCPVHPKQRELFVTGGLWSKWAESYRNSFDADDLRIARNQACLGYHFYEWLAAIVLYQSTGYLSLVEQYQFRNHARKQATLSNLLPSQTIERCPGEDGKGCNFNGYLVVRRNRRYGTIFLGC